MKLGAEGAYRARAFGCRWCSDLPLYGFANDADDDPEAGAPPADISVRLCADAPAYRGESASESRLRHVVRGSRCFVDEVATIDTFGSSRVEVRPGPEWEGRLPVEVFGGIAGVLMAWRGLLPMHGSAVEMDGRGVLICGASGAGKSTLAAALIAQGARLISDDLSVLYPRRGDVPLVYAGRKTMRLFPDLAAMLGERVAWGAEPRRADRKMLVTPPRVGAVKGVPLALLVVLGAEQEPGSEDELFRLLRLQMFRRDALARVPGYPLRLAHLRALPAVLPVAFMERQQARNHDDLVRLAKSAEIVVSRATVPL